MTLVYATELKRFSSREREYAFLIPSSMVLELDSEVRSILDALEDGPKPIDALATSPSAEGALREPLPACIAGGGSQ